MEVHTPAFKEETERWAEPSWPHHLRRPFMLQRWESLAFIHWSFPPDVIRPLLPACLQQGGIELDTFNGKAWVGLVPFLLTGLRLPSLPPFPWLGQFPETNVRTYLRGHDGKPAVWFFTLEADRLGAVLAARAGYGLPYRWAQMSVDTNAKTVAYQSQRSRYFGPGQSEVMVEPGPAFTAGPLEHFLTARFRLYSTFGARVAYADVDHDAWTLQRARVLSLEQDLFHHSGVPQPAGEPVVQFSRSLEVRIGRPRLL